MTDDLTVSELREEVADIDDPDELESMLTAEKDGKDRVTAKDAIKERLDEVDEDAEHEDDGDDGESLPSGHIRVKPAPGSGGGHIAGYSFEPHEVKRVPPNGQVQKALMRGKLQRVA